MSWNQGKFPIWKIWIPNAYGIFSKVNRYNIFTKNGFVLPTEKFQSLGTILAFTHNSQNSNYGNINYDNEQNSLFINLIWQSSFDSPHHDTSASEEDVHNSYSLGFSYLHNNYIESWIEGIGSTFGLFFHLLMVLLI